MRTTIYLFTIFNFQKGESSSELQEAQGTICRGYIHIHKASFGRIFIAGSQMRLRINRKRRVRGRYLYLSAGVDRQRGERRNTRWSTLLRLHANIYTFPWNSRYWLSWREWNPSVPFLTFPRLVPRIPEPDTAPMANVSPRIGKEITVREIKPYIRMEKWIISCAPIFLHRSFLGEICLPILGEGAFLSSLFFFYRAETKNGYGSTIWNLY